MVCETAALFYFHLKTRTFFSIVLKQLRKTKEKKFFTLLRFDRRNIEKLQEKPLTVLKRKIRWIFRWILLSEEPAREKRKNGEKLSWLSPLFSRWCFNEYVLEDQRGSERSRLRFLLPQKFPPFVTDSWGQKLFTKRTFL